MKFSVHLQDFHFTPSAGFAHISSRGESRVPIVCRDIPPERIGLEGNYDHAGLSKRVEKLLEKEFVTIAPQIRVSQRGQVVQLLSKTAIPAETAFEMVDRILLLPGATSVEINGVRHLRPSLYWTGC